MLRIIKKTSYVLYYEGISVVQYTKHKPLGAMWIVQPNLLISIIHIIFVTYFMRQTFFQQIWRPFDYNNTYTKEILYCCRYFLVWHILCNPKRNVGTRKIERNLLVKQTSNKQNKWHLSKQISNVFRYFSFYTRIRNLFTHSVRTFSSKFRNKSLNMLSCFNKTSEAIENVFSVLVHRFGLLVRSELRTILTTLNKQSYSNFMQVCMNMCERMLTQLYNSIPFIVW